MNKKEMGEIVNKYVAVNRVKKATAKQADELKDIIKEYLVARGFVSFEADEGSVVLSTRTTKKLDAEKVAHALGGKIPEDFWIETTSVALNVKEAPKGKKKTKVA